MHLSRVLSILSLLFFIRRTFSEAIVRGPLNQAADVGLWANFSCSVSCDHLINWFVEGYPSDISTTCTSTHNDLMVCKQSTHECDSAIPGATNYTETLRVLAKTEHAGTKIAVQCAAVRRIVENRNSCNPFITFSRYAVLTVSDQSVAPTPTPCTPQDTTTITEVSTVTETRAGITDTVTSTVVSTITVTETPSTTPPPLPSPNSVTDSRRQFGKILTELFMWVFTIAVGLLFAKVTVLL